MKNPMNRRVRFIKENSMAFILERTLQQKFNQKKSSTNPNPTKHPPFNQEKNTKNHVKITHK
jgi:hypothetical protein